MWLYKKRNRSIEEEVTIAYLLDCACFGFVLITIKSLKKYFSNSLSSTVLYSGHTTFSHLRTFVLWKTNAKSVKNCIFWI